MQWLTVRRFSYLNIIWQFIKGLKVSIWLLLVAIVSSYLTWNLSDVRPLNPVMWNTMGCYTIALHLNSIKGHHNINMMRACDCSWLLASNMLITRLHGLPSDRAYQGVQLPQAPATGNEGWSTFMGGVVRERSPGMERRSVYALSSSAFQFTTMGHQGWWGFNVEAKNLTAKIYNGKRNLVVLVVIILSC